MIYNSLRAWCDNESRLFDKLITTHTSAIAFLPPVYRLIDALARIKKV